SETACFPAKISHGHIMDLIEKDVNFIFYPNVFYENQEDKTVDNSLNCPVVAGYPEDIKHNTDALQEKDIAFLNPLLSFNDRKSFKKQLKGALQSFNIGNREFNNALDEAWEELNRYRLDIR